MWKPIVKIQTLYKKGDLKESLQKLCKVGLKSKTTNYHILKRSPYCCSTKGQRPNPALPALKNKEHMCVCYAFKSRE